MLSTSACIGPAKRVSLACKLIGRQKGTRSSFCRCRASKTREISGPPEPPPSSQGSAALVDQKPGYVTFSFGADMEFFVSELPDGRLNIREVYLTGGANPDRIRPTIRGTIEEEPAFYHVMPVQALKPGDRMKDIEEEYELEHVVLTRILSQDPYELDFRSVYCFDCQRQEFYRVEPIEAHDDIVEPVLRFRPRDRVFIIDEADLMPPPHLVVEEKEAQELGLEVCLDPCLEEIIAQFREADAARHAEGALQPDEVLEPEQEDFELDDFDDMHDDIPDVPAVDLA